MKWLLRVVTVLVTCYAALFGAVLLAMRQPPERFGRIMKHLPASRRPIPWTPGSWKST